MTNVDIGHDWLIFGLPPAEVAVHMADANGRHEFDLMCDDIPAFVTEMQRHDISCSPVDDLGRGLLVRLTLPGGGQLGMYQPCHAHPAPMKEL